MKRFNFSLLSLPVALYLTAVFAFVACNREEPAATGQQRADAIEVKDGRLQFATEEQLTATLKQLAQQQSRLDEWEKQFSGFTSMRTAFSKLKDEDYYKIASGNMEPYQDIITIIGEGEEKEAVRVISDGILATLVSKDGFLYVGNKAYKYGWDKMYIVEDFTAEKLKGINFKAGQGAGQFKTLPVTHRLVRKYNQALPSGKTTQSVQCIQNYSYNNSTKRMVGDIDYQGYGSHTNVTIMSKHQQRILGTWYAQNTAYVHVQGSATSIYSQALNIYDTRYNEGFCSVSFPEDCAFIYTYHEVKCHDNDASTGDKRIRFCEQYVE